MYGLTEKQYDLFMQVHNKHMKVMGTDNQNKYALENVERVIWDSLEGCLKVYYKDIWWHYTKDLTWY
ncbi:hypothetical protein [Bacillus sp. AFS075034]|uniref:hypothetical protein n=1 Tax=Bacillus sp. AFS075034 TaxID=2034281 RepID=UPI000BF62A5F|nr:hypothetical protein [Bacillus sp. AFS075034]PFW61533.1 hypothetical protein COL20_16970 [Bacillus sp. AFS075034]